MKGVSSRDQLQGEGPEVLASLIEEKAQNLFLTRQFHCAQAVLCTLNEALRGGLPRELAARLASGLAEGLGKSGCLCGALSGGVLALGLFMGKSEPSLLNTSDVTSSTGLLYQKFVERFGSTCCKVISKKVRHDTKAHFEQCAELTGAAAELATRIILEAKPQLAKIADLEYLTRKDSMLMGTLNRILPGIADRCRA